VRLSADALGDTTVCPQRASRCQNVVLSLLALLVVLALLVLEYKYCSLSTRGQVLAFVLSFLALLVLKYKYCSLLL
jgi:hypothetical protein